MILLDALALLWATHASPLHTTAIERAAMEHHADVALVASIAQRESSSGTHGTILCGAMLHLPMSACMSDPSFVARVRAARRAHRRPPPCINRDPDAQAQHAARLFGGVPRRHWVRMLAGWRCGPNAICQSTDGVRYGREVVAMRDALHRALRRTP